MWNKLVGSIVSLTFWFVFFIVSCLAYTIVLTYFGHTEYVPVWLIPLANLGMVFCFIAGIFPVIFLGLQMIYNKLCSPKASGGMTAW